MEIKTSRIDEVNALVREMGEERGDHLLARRSLHAADRDRAGHYFAIIEFDSYEEAMKNSNDPVTSEFAQKLSALLDEPPKFHNLDVLQELRR
ncbi:MAG: hypothetical protein ABSA65_09310 [Acidimicrobiales bacterium]